MIVKDPGFVDKLVEAGIASYDNLNSHPPLSQQDIFYLSGPMTGIDGFNYDYFNMVAKMMRSSNLYVINPADNFNGDSTRDRSEYMRADIQFVLDSSDIVLLPGWQKSSGARLEAEVAYQIGLQMWYLVEHRDERDTLVACSMAPAERESVKQQLDSETTPEPRVLPILEEAAQLTSEDRQRVYGRPLEDFSKVIGMINELFAAKLVEPFEPRDWTSMMICCKLARLEKTPDHRDSLLDIVGYARTREMIQEDTKPW